MNIAQAAELQANIRARDGAVCIYAEKRWIALTTMSIASLTDTFVGLKFSTLSTPGFTPPRRDWEAGGALSECRFAPDYWMGSPYLAWIIAFDSEVIAALVGIAYEMRTLQADERALALRGRLGGMIWREPTGWGTPRSRCAVR